jgi:uncharacterized glyoxalase superfamily protein PhnB
MEHMGLELFMLGLIVQDMPASLEFYRRLGVAIPDGSEKLTHVEVKMGTGLTFFLDSNPNRWDPCFDKGSNPQASEAPDRYPSIIEFYLKDEGAVRAKYTEMVEHGYQGYREPYITSFGMCFAMLKDPDGNTVLISGDAAPDSKV